MLMAITSIGIGFILLTWAADRFVTGAAALARNFGIPPLLIGLTIVALGTSAPEIFVAINASLKGNASLAIGNALGSNIANIGLVLGIAAMISPMKVHSSTLRREYPILFLIMLLAWVLMIDGDLSRFDGTVLISALVVFMLWLIYLGLKSRTAEPMIEEFEKEIPMHMSTGHASMWLLIGLVLLPFGSDLIVSGAVTLAKFFGISDLVIGLTVVAIGTSLPEVAAAVAAALKSEHDIAIGNIVGSNMFNLLAVLPFPGLINPGTLAPEVMTRDMPVMFAITILLFLVAYGFRGPGHVSRWEGALLICCYLAYLGLLIVGT